jgi:hypothetical protein
MQSRSRRAGGPADRSRRFPACSDVAGSADFTRYSPNSTSQPSRRAVPYHVQLSGPRGPGRAPDQQIRWHTRAQASLNQRRRAPFCPSKCPSDPAPSGPRHTGQPQIRRPFERTCQSIREVPEHRAQASAGHLADPSPGGQPGRPGQPASRQPTDPQIHWRTHSSVAAWRSPPEQPHHVRICRIAGVASSYAYAPGCMSRKSRRSPILQCHPYRGHACRIGRDAPVSPQ